MEQAYVERLRSDLAEAVEFLRVVAQCTSDEGATKQWMEDHAVQLLRKLQDRR